LYGYLWHHSPEQMAHDQARQRQLVLAGWRVLVFTWRDVWNEPERVIEQICQAVLISAQASPGIFL
jgi:very-short-patch-repair endonuclease